MIGDLHGNFTRYGWIIRNYDCSIALGDIGLGFPNKPVSMMPAYPEHRFIRGNHDNPATCKLHSSYLGDYGFIESPSIFFISGALSVDRRMRQKGTTWWEDEQLDVPTLERMVSFFSEKKPRIVVSHDCPETVAWLMQTDRLKLEDPSDTRDFLQAAFEAHQPDYWFYGHWHRTQKMKIGNTEFTCVGELDAVELKDVSW